MLSSGLGWKLLGPIVGAIVMGLAALLWDGLRDNITKGKADEAVVEKLEAAVQVIDTKNTSEHKVIVDKMKRDGRVLRAVAKKLKVDLPPEPVE